MYVPAAFTDLECASNIPAPFIAKLSPGFDLAVTGQVEESPGSQSNPEASRKLYLLLLLCATDKTIGCVPWEGTFSKLRLQHRCLIGSYQPPWVITRIRQLLKNVLIDRLLHHGRPTENPQVIARRLPDDCIFVLVAQSNDPVIAVKRPKERYLQFCICR